MSLAFWKRQANTTHPNYFTILYVSLQVRCDENKLHTTREMKSYVFRQFN